MTTESQQQIADEAVQEFFGDARKVPRSKLRAIILSAIERAARKQREQSNHTQRLIGLTKLSKAAHEAAQPHRGDEWAHREHDRPPQPQRSEQQEWREADGLIYEGDTFIGRAFTTGEAKKLCAAITAALTDERQRREQAEIEVARLAWKIDSNDKTKIQLLSALAAIDKCLTKWNPTKEDLERYSNRNTYYICARDLQQAVGDLSLLHKHDKELTDKVRKPLVDALEAELHRAKLDERESAYGRHDQLTRATGYRNGIEYALAKVKEST